MPRLQIHDIDPDAFYLGGDLVSRMYYGSTLIYPIGYVLGAGTGMYELAGQEAILQAANKLDAVFGAYTLTGQAANLAKHTRGISDYGQYTLTGQSVQLSKSIIMPADYGSYMLSGQDVALTRYVLEAEAGDYILAGQNLELLLAARLEAEQGSYTLTGQDVEFAVGTIAEAEGGTYTLVGMDISFLREAYMFAEPGTYTYTGNEAGLIKSLKLTAEQGSYTLSGQDAIVRKAWRMTAAQGSVALTGQAATLTYTQSPLRTKVGSFDTGTGAAATTVAVTGVGFQPVIVLFWWSGGVGADSVAGGDSRLGVGYGISSSSRGAQSIWYDDGNNSGAASRSLFNDRCIAINTDETVDGAIDFQSLDVDGFTLVVDNNMPSSYRIHYLAIGGTGVTASGAQMTMPASPGNSDITSLSEAPDMLGIITNAYTTINAPFNDGSNGRFITAFSDMADDVSLMINSVNATAAASNAVAMFDQEIYFSSSLRGVASPLVNGFRIAWSASNAAAHLMWYRINGVYCKVGSFQTRTDTTAQAITGLGFRPKAVIFMSGGQTTIDSEAAVTERGSWGAVDSALNQRVASSKSVHAADPTNVGLGHNSAAVYQQIADGDTQEGLMQINSLDADGFTFQMADADPSARYVTYCAIG